MSQDPSKEPSLLIAELRHRLNRGDLAIGQLVEVEDQRIRIEGFDPLGATTRRVYVRFEQGERLTLKIENC